MATVTARPRVTACEHETPLERAVERATVAQLEPAGYGRMRDGSRVWLVPSTSEEGRLHIVRTFGRRHLRCDCVAAEHGRVCVHVASVVMDVTARAIERERFAERVAQCVESDAGAQPCEGEGMDEEAAMWHALNARTLAIAEKLDCTLARAEQRRADVRAAQAARTQAQLDETECDLARLHGRMDAYDARQHPKLADDTRAVSIFR